MLALKPSIFVVVKSRNLIIKLLLNGAFNLLLTNVSNGCHLFGIFPAQSLTTTSIKAQKIIDLKVFF